MWLLHNPPLERTAAAVYFTCGRASRVRRRGRSTAIRYPAMSDPRMPRDDRPYRPSGWATASVLVAAAGWFVQLYFAAGRGADLAQGAIVNAVMTPLALLVVPWVLGTICCILARGSRRAGDIAFSIAMIAQGLVLAAAGAVAG